MMQKKKMSRSQEMTQDIVVVDGMGRSGKALVAAVLSSLERGELWQLNHLYEYLCVIDSFGKIDRDAARALCRLYADFDLYNLMIGRHANLRPKDVSGAANNLMQERIQQRLGAPDGDVIANQIQRERPILILVTHFILGEADLLFDAFGERLKLYAIPVRHPLWAIESWFDDRWHSRIGKDPRDFKLCLRHKDQDVPWFAKGWEEEYICAKPIEQAIRVVAFFWDSFFEKISELRPEDQKKIAFVCYEHFVTDPVPRIKELADHLETTPSSLTEDMMKKMGIPRQISERAIPEQKDKINGILDGEDSSAKVRKTLKRLCEEYEERFLQGNPILIPAKGVSV